MLKYLGKGYVAGVRAQDLSADDIETLRGGELGATAAKVKASLIATGLYEAVPLKLEKKEQASEEGGGN